MITTILFMIAFIQLTIAGYQIAYLRSRKIRFDRDCNSATAIEKLELD